jgi:hypothetical protein
MKRSFTPVRWAQKNIAFEVNSEPLSQTRVLGSRRFRRFELANEPLVRDREVDDLQDAFPRVIVDDVEYPEPPAVGELIAHEVDRPALVDGVGDEHRYASPEQLLPLLRSYL